MSTVSVTATLPGRIRRILCNVWRTQNSFYLCVCELAYVYVIQMMHYACVVRAPLQSSLISFRRDGARRLVMEQQQLDQTQCSRLIFYFLMLVLVGWLL